MKLHLWQLGFTSDSFIRGSATPYNVYKVMEKVMLDGGSTEKHPIEVVPFLGGKVPGQGVEVSGSMTSIGSSVVTSAYLICLWVIQRGYLNGPLSVAVKATLQPLAKVVLSVMNIRSTVPMSL